MARSALGRFAPLAKHLPRGMCVPQALCFLDIRPTIPRVANGLQFHARLLSDPDHAAIANGVDSASMRWCISRSAFSGSYCACGFN